LLFLPGALWRQETSAVVVSSFPVSSAAHQIIFGFVSETGHAFWGEVTTRK
jgi:hypothetical protein